MDALRPSDGKFPHPTRPSPTAPAAFRVVAPDRYEAMLTVSEPDAPLEHVKRLVLGSPFPGAWPAVGPSVA
jgi:hypothetical protein